VLGGLTALIAALYIASPVIQSGDGRLVVYESHSEIHQANTDLSEFGGVVDGFPCYRVGSRIISRYPWGTSVMTVPLIAVAEAGGRLVGHDPTAQMGRHPPRTLEKGLAGVLAALGCLALMILALQMTGRLAPALLLGVIYALGTSMWSTVSRGLWQHGPLILLESVALIFLVRARQSGGRGWAIAAGLPMGAAFAVRPTAAVPIALVGLYLLLSERRAAVAYGVAVAAAASPRSPITTTSTGPG
jgi:hypothetical protein